MNTKNTAVTRHKMQMWTLPKAVTYRLPREWLKKVLVHQPEKLIRACKQGCWIPMAMVSPEDYPIVEFHEEDAQELCCIYLGLTDKTLWPTLVGISPAMDRELAKACKWE